MRCFFIALLLFLVSFAANSQDTVFPSLGFDSSSKQTEDSSESPDDSLYRVKMERNIAEKGKDLDKFLNDYKEYQQKEQRQKYIRYGVGVLFAAALIYGFIRKRKQQQKNKRN